MHIFVEVLILYLFINPQVVHVQEVVFKLMLLNFIIQLAEDCISIQNLSLLLCIIIEDFSAERVIFIQCLCILFTVFGSYSLSLDLIHNLWIIFIVVGSYQ